MVKYGYTSFTDKYKYGEYICGCCEKHLGRIEIIYDGNQTKEYDDIVGWNFCPYCGNKLWDEESWLE